MLKLKVLFFLIGMQLMTATIYGQNSKRLTVDSIQFDKINIELNQVSDYSPLEKIDILDRIKKSSISCKNNLNWCGNGNHFAPNNPENLKHKPSKTERIFGTVGALVSAGIFYRLIIRSRI